MWSAVPGEGRPGERSKGVSRLVIRDARSLSLRPSRSCAGTESCSDRELALGEWKGGRKAAESLFGRTDREEKKRPKMVLRFSS